VDWTNTSPLTTSPLSIATTNISNQDFGIRRLTVSVLLVKRITKLNGQVTTRTGIPLNVYENELGYPYDDNDNTHQPTAIYPQKGTNKWPNTNGHISSSFLLGAIGGVTVKPQDELEYTIYFLSTGERNANSVSLCDLIPNNQTFVPYAYNGSGSAGFDRGMALSIGTTPEIGLTNINDLDKGRYYTPGETLPAPCKIAGAIPTNLNGAVVVNLGTLPKPSSATTADPNGYGYIRFRTKIK
jgi:uncharacterized repeat protein (TIGR01451 family)